MKTEHAPRRVPTMRVFCVCMVPAAVVDLETSPGRIVKYINFLYIIIMKKKSLRAPGADEEKLYGHIDHISDRIANVVTPPIYLPRHRFKSRVE